MLILRRRVGESVRIGGDVDITILDIGPSRVKLGVEAPVGVPVVRSEILLTREENRQAAESKPTPTDLEGLAKSFLKNL